MPPGRVLGLKGLALRVKSVGFGDLGLAVQNLTFRLFGFGEVLELSYIVGIWNYACATVEKASPYRSVI